MFSRVVLFATLGLSLLTAGDSWAVSQTLMATLRFETLLSLTNITNVDLGTLQAGTAGTYTISPSGSVSATNNGVVLGGATQPASITIAGSQTQGIAISANNYTANNGVTPSEATCAYDGGNAVPCAQTVLAAPGSGKTLKVGLTVMVDGTQGINTTAAPTFDLVVNYN